MITIKLNKELDYEVYKDFWDFKMAGADFAAAIKRDHPAITPETSEKYIDTFYDGNSEVLEVSRAELENALNQKQKLFFDELNNLFGIDFGSDTYTGYISIFDCNPRYVDSGSFQVFYKRDSLGKLEVALHESLHFAFFKFCDKALSGATNGVDKNSGRLWELSEIFNVIVLNLPEFQKILGREERLFYPQLAGRLEICKEAWGRKKSLADFILQCLSQR